MSTPRHLTARLIGALFVGVGVWLLYALVVAPADFSSEPTVAVPIREPLDDVTEIGAGAAEDSQRRGRALPVPDAAPDFSELLFVQWPAGSPLSAELSWRMWPAADDTRAITVESDADGRLALGPEFVGEWTIQSTSAQLLLLDGLVHIEPGRTYLIRVEAAATVRTRVVSNAGNPISGAEVEYLHSDFPPDDYLSLNQNTQTETTDSGGYTPSRTVFHVHALRLRVCAEGFFPATVRPFIRSDRLSWEEPQEILVTLTPLGPDGISVTWQAAHSSPWSLGALFDEKVPGYPSHVRIGQAVSGDTLEIPRRWRTAQTRWILSTRLYSLDIPDSSIAGPSADSIVLRAPETSQFSITTPEWFLPPIEWSVFAEVYLKGSVGPSTLSLLATPSRHSDSSTPTEFTCELPLSGRTTIRAYDSRGTLCSWTGETSTQQQRIELACQQTQDSVLTIRSPVPLRQGALASKDFREIPITLDPTGAPGDYSARLVSGTNALTVEDVDGLKYLIRLKQFGTRDSIDVVLPRLTTQEVTLLVSDTTGKPWPGLDFVLTGSTMGSTDSPFAKQDQLNGEASVQVVGRMQLQADAVGAVNAVLPVGAYSVAVREVTDSGWGTADLKIMKPMDAWFRLFQGDRRVDIIVEALRRVSIHVPLGESRLDPSLPPQWTLKDKYGQFSSNFYGESTVIYMGSEARAFFLEAPDGRVSKDLFVPQSFNNIEVEVQW